MKSAFQYIRGSGNMVLILNTTYTRAPGLYAQGGNDLIEGGTTVGEAAFGDYGTHHYHQVSDNYNPDWDFRGVIQDLETLYQVGATLANETTFPAWAKDSPFRAKQEAMMDTKP